MGRRVSSRAVVAGAAPATPTRNAEKTVAIDETRCAKGEQKELMAFSLCTRVYGDEINRPSEHQTFRHAPSGVKESP